MKIFTWMEIETFYNSKQTDPFFEKGSGITVGSFDGLHLGHRELIRVLQENCKNKDIIPGVVSFTKPLPGIKHKEDYQGDISTLNQRLQIFEELGVEFVIVIDFNDKFASLSGVEFLSILKKVCNMKFITEGVDFRFGYKGSTDVSALKYYAQNNNIDCSFVDQVIFNDGGIEERVSSSLIRTMISKGYFATVELLLKHPYEIDVLQSGQVLPPDGVYHCKNEKNEEIRVVISKKELKIEDNKQASKVIFNS